MIDQFAFSDWIEYELISINVFVWTDFLSWHIKSGELVYIGNHPLHDSEYHTN